MKLVTYFAGEGMKAGLVVKNHVVDLERASLVPGLRSGKGAPISPSLKEVLERGDEGFEQCWRIQSHFLDLSEERYPPGCCTPLQEVKLAPPIPDPQKVICIGMNYRDHCREQNKPLPDRPIIFAKFPTALVGHGQPIVKPRLTNQLDYEAELAVIIGKRCKDVSPQNALSQVAGYTIMNDVTARDIQFSDGQWVRGKTFDTFAPAGPYLVTKDEVPDPQNLRIRLMINGELRQDSSTANMVFSVAFLVSYISEVCTFLPGDIISTGTPGGVGVFRKPPVFLKGGDIVSVEIEGLGTLTNPVAEMQ